MHVKNNSFAGRLNHRNFRETGPWAPNGLNELPELRVIFPFDLMGKLTTAFFKKANHSVNRDPGTLVGSKKEDFGAVSRTAFTRALVSSVALTIAPAVVPFVNGRCHFFKTLLLRVFLLKRKKIATESRTRSSNPDPLSLTTTLPH